MTANELSVSVVIPFAERVGDVAELLNFYCSELSETGYSFELICVLDGNFTYLEPMLRDFKLSSGRLKVIKFARVYGEGEALGIGIRAAQSELVLILPSYIQVAEGGIRALLAEIQDADIVVARRWPRRDSLLNRLSSKAFHGILWLVTRAPYRDLGCGVKLFRKAVFDELSVYGDQFRFLPLLADRRGFKVVEVNVPQSTEDQGTRLYGVRVYASRLIDLLGIFFLVRFTKKPLRFFGILASLLGGIGLAILAVISFQRLFLDIGMADRPIMLLGSLLLVLGAQLFALGLVGELVIFTHARDQKEYAIFETINLDDTDNDEQQ